MNLEAYLKRINYRGPLEPTFETLRGLHCAHLLAIPYENLDIHLGFTLELDEARFFERLVLERRGGWCYEMNGLFAWALRALGFTVHLLGGAVNREVLGEGARLNHLVLLVDLDRPYLVDVGFGNGFLEPLPLQEGSHRQGFLSYGLSTTGEWWRFDNHRQGGPGFDFSLEPYHLGAFTEKCRELQTSPESGFVRLTVCHRFVPNGVISLRGAVLKTVTATGVTERTVESSGEYAKVLREGFGLELENVQTLWQKVWARHLDWLGMRA